MINKKVFTASINSTGTKNMPRYNRLKIPKKYIKELKELILEYKLDEVTIKYRSEEAKIPLNNLLFSDYDELDHRKFEDWSGNKHSSVTLDLSNFNNGIIEISKIY